MRQVRRDAVRAPARDYSKPFANSASGAAFAVASTSSPPMRPCAVALNDESSSPSSIRTRATRELSAAAQPRALSATASYSATGMFESSDMVLTSEFSRCIHYVNTGELFSDGFESP